MCNARDVAVGLRQAGSREISEAARLCRGGDYSLVATSDVMGTMTFLSTHPQEEEDSNDPENNLRYGLGMTASSTTSFIDRIASVAAENA